MPISSVWCYVVEPSLSLFLLYDSFQAKPLLLTAVDLKEESITFIINMWWLSCSNMSKLKNETAAQVSFTGVPTQIFLAVTSSSWPPSIGDHQLLRPLWISTCWSFAGVRKPWQMTKWHWPFAQCLLPSTDNTRVLLG